MMLGWAILTLLVVLAAILIVVSLLLRTVNNHNDECIDDENDIGDHDLDLYGYKGRQRWW